MEEFCAAELRSIDFYLANSEEELLKVMTRLEKLWKDKIESKEKLQQQNRTRKNWPIKKYETSWSDADNKKSEWVRKKRLVASSIKIYISFNLK